MTTGHTNFALGKLAQVDFCFNFLLLVLEQLSGVTMFL